MKHNREFIGRECQGEFGRLEKRGIFGAIAAAAIGATGAIGGGLLASQGAKSAARSARPRQQTIPIPPFAKAGQELVARDFALNMNAIPPSFIDFIKSGGQSTFPMQTTGMTPLEARQLGVIGPQGQQIPFVDPSQRSLSPQQLMFLGFQLANLKGPAGQSPLANLYRTTKREEHLETLPQDPKRVAREAKLKGKEAIIKKNIGARSRAAGLDFGG